MPGLSGTARLTAVIQRCEAQLRAILAAGGRGALRARRPSTTRIISSGKVRRLLTIACGSVPHKVRLCPALHCGASQWASTRTC